MCGRTCLTLEPVEIQKASTYKSGTDEKTPEWREEYNFDRQYKPSYNQAPTDVTPVLVSARHFDDECDSNDRVVVPMLWGMIPFWHLGDYRKHGLKTNNCRLESMLESKLYKNAFEKGQRCVVLAEGFYEWQTTDPKASKASERAAFYIYMPQQKDIQIENKETWQSTADKLNLLKMAGLFDVWTDERGDKVFSYSVITFESDDHLSWLHHRSPAVLETDEQVADWLNFERIKDSKCLLGLLKAPKELKWHRVSNAVNNSRNKSEECNKKCDESKKIKYVMPKSNMLKSWLIVKKRKRSDDDEKDNKSQNQ